jgi:hypothetical protein
MGKRFGGLTPWAEPVPRAVPEGMELESSTPARPADVIADLVVPLGQAAVTGALLAGLVVFLVWELAPHLDGDPVKVWAGLALGISAVAWLLLLADTRRLLWALERVTGRDLDRDGTAGPPGKRTLEVEVKEGNRRRIIGADWLGMDDDRLILLAAHLVRGGSLAEGALGKSSAIFPAGINDFRKVRGKLIEAGLIAQVNPDAPSQGHEVTPAGRAVFRRLVEEARTHAHTRTGAA